MAIDRRAFAKSAFLLPLALALRIDPIRFLTEKFILQPADEYRRDVPNLDIAEKLLKLLRATFVVSPGSFFLRQRQIDVVNEIREAARLR
jgi:hypothetical protein